MLRKKDHRIKELTLLVEDGSKGAEIQQDALDKLTEKVKKYQAHVLELETAKQKEMVTIRKLQRELEGANDRVKDSEESLTLFKSKHRAYVKTGVSEFLPFAGDE